MTDQQPGPDYTRPPQGWTPPPNSWPPPQQDWAQPNQQPGYPAPQPSWPSPQPPAPRRRRWPLAVAVAVLVAMVATGALVVPSVLGRPAAPPGAQPSASTTALPVVTVSPAAQPTAQTVLSTGGELAAPTTFSSRSGTGTLTITRATWTHAGRMAPPEGKAYLIVEVSVECTGGELDVSSLSLRTTSDPGAQSAFGADLSDQFPGVRLSAGMKQSGQVAFVLAERQLTVALLDPATLEPVATRVVPAP